ncbi:MAG: hypothetical protein JNM01_04180 [Delftia acidovorans]|nr:hypothetical protein [Delftia acidovorans]
MGGKAHDGAVGQDDAVGITARAGEDHINAALGLLRLQAGHAQVRRHGARAVAGGRLVVHGLAAGRVHDGIRLDRTTGFAAADDAHRVAHLHGCRERVGHMGREPDHRAVGQAQAVHLSIRIGQQPGDGAFEHGLCVRRARPCRG